MPWLSWPLPREVHATGTIWRAQPGKGGLATRAASLCLQRAALQKSRAQRTQLARPNPGQPSKGRPAARSLRGRRHRSETGENRGSRGATDKPRVVPWAQGVVLHETGLSPVAADAPSAAQAPRAASPCPRCVAPRERGEAAKPLRGVFSNQGISCVSLDRAPSTWSVPDMPRDASSTTRNSAVIAKPITMAVSVSAWGMGSA